VPRLRRVPFVPMMHPPTSGNARMRAPSADVCCGRGVGESLANARCVRAR
jgi:hypothetical protein